MLAENRGKTAVLLPCYNEGLTIGRTVRQFRQALPSAEIWVFDNNSSDDTVAEARKAGARICHVRQQGKGHVVRCMFQKIDADYYIMADGDATYPAEEAPVLLKPLQEGIADMTVGDRLSGTYGAENKRKFHHFGNLLVADGQTLPLLGPGQRHPQAAPCAELVIVREDILHLVRGIAGGKGADITIMLRH